MCQLHDKFIDLQTCDFSTKMISNLRFLKMSVKEERKLQLVFGRLVGA